MTHVEGANQYISDVLEGRIVACKQTIQACQRQRDDLLRTDWDYYFDEEAAEIVCDFCELLTHVAGPLAGERLKLENWQKFVTCSVFGWRSKTTGYRRFQRSIIFCGKGNGKSFLHSAWSIYMLTSDGRDGAQIYSGARSEQMARIVFDVAYQQVLANDELRTATGLKAMKKGIFHGASGSFMKTVSGIGKGSAGLLPYFVTLDESWSHKDAELVLEIRRGCAKVPGSLMSSISHCGPNLGSVGYQQYQEGEAILSSELSDDRTFVCIWSGIDFPWTDERSWKSANPNYGISVDPAQLSDAARLAEKLPVQQGIFRSHNLAEWVEADTSWLEPDFLVKCRERDLCMSEYRLWLPDEIGTGDPTLRPFAFGFDLAATQDLAAVVYLTTCKRGGQEHWCAWGDYYASENSIASSPNANFKSFAAKGLLHVHPGYVIDFEKVQADILARHRCNKGYGLVVNEFGYNLVLCAHDNHQAEMLRQNLVKADITAVPFDQHAVKFTPPMDFLASLIMTGRFHYPFEDEVMRWAFSNVRIQRDRQDKIKPVKTAPELKIDPVVALIMAVAAGISDGGKHLRPTTWSNPVIGVL